MTRPLNPRLELLHWLFAGSLVLLPGCGGGDSGSDLLTAVPVIASATNAGLPAIPPPVTTPTTPTVPTPDPANVVFFRDSAAGGGNGSSATPYKDLTTALGATNPGQTLFLFAGSGVPISFSGSIPDGIVLQGEGFGLSTGGALNIPAGAFPRIQGTVTLGANNTVRGIQFESLTGDALLVGPNANVSANRFTNLTGTAVVYRGISGNSFLSNNTFQDDPFTDPASGVSVTLAQSEALNLTFSGNTFSTTDRTASFDNALRVNAAESAQLQLTAENNTIQTQNTGILLNLSAQVALSGLISSNQFTGCGAEAVSVLVGALDTDTTGSNLEVSDNICDRNLGPAIVLRARGRSGHQWTLRNNQITSLANFGILLTRTDTSTLESTVLGNRVASATEVGIQLTSGTPSAGFITPLLGGSMATIDDNMITGSGVADIVLNLIDQSTEAHITDNDCTGGITALIRSLTGCLLLESNSASNLALTVESGFQLTLDDRGGNTPGLTTLGGGNVTPGTCP